MGPGLASQPAALFGAVIDDLVKLSPIPAIIVRAHEVDANWSPHRIAVLVSGTLTSQRAEDLALAIARPEDSNVGIHVVTTDLGTLRPDLAADIAREFRERATRVGHSATTDVREASNVESGILAALADLDADLIILGTNSRAGTTRLFLGQRVENIARQSPCPVAIVNA